MQMNIACNTGLIQGMNILLPHDQLDPSYIQSNALLHQAQVGPSSSGLDMAMSTTQQMTLQCPMSAPMQLVNTFMDSCYNNVRDINLISILCFNVSYKKIFYVIFKI